jgi:hypothetical protein
MNNLKETQKVFGLGLSKTGTNSLAEALNTLGIKTIHWPHDQKTYDELKNGNYRLSLLEEYQGVVDTPVAPYYAQFDSIYPGSKFILTVRDTRSWLRSAETHWRVEMDPLSQEHPEREYRDFISACVYGTIKFNRDRFLYVYNTHLQNVCRYFWDRPNDLLVMDICQGDGWEKLCPFIGSPIPEVPFPHAYRWISGILDVSRGIAALIPSGETFILVDQDQLRSEVAAGRCAIPFLARDGQYWGTPPDDETAIRELERLRRSGASFIVFAWPAFWWLEHYVGLREHLRSEYRCVLENECLIAFDLKP